MADKPFVEAGDLSAAPHDPRMGHSGGDVSLREARDRVEREMAINAISRSGRNIVRAAEDLGISRPTLYDLMKKHNVE
jgi:two-component system, NtrC family, response regulator